MSKKIPSWHDEMHKAILEISMTYCLNAKDLMPFLTATLCGQFALAGYSDEFVKKTLDKMFENYLNVKKKLKEERGIE